MVEAPHCTQIYAHQPSLSMCCRHCRRALQRQSVCVRRFGGLSFSPSYARGGAFFTLIVRRRVPSCASRRTRFRCARDWPRRRNGVRAAALFVTTSTMCNVSSASWNAFCRTGTSRAASTGKLARFDRITLSTPCRSPNSRGLRAARPRRARLGRRGGQRGASAWEWFAHRCSRSRFRRPMVKLAPDNPGFGTGSCQIFTRCANSPIQARYSPRTSKFTIAAALGRVAFLPRFSPRSSG